MADTVRHALAADDFTGAAHLMEEALPALRRARQDGVLLAWMRVLPEPAVRRSPVLSTVSAWSLLMSGDVDAAGSRLDHAEAALAAGAHDETLRASWADTEDLRTAPETIAIYRAAVAQARGDVDATVRHARRVLDLAGPVAAALNLLDRLHDVAAVARRDGSLLEIRMLQALAGRQAYRRFLQPAPATVCDAGS